LDNKKIMAAKETAIEFRTKRISLTNVRPEVLNEIYKFSFHLQRLVAEEVHAVAKRLEEGKCLPNLVRACQILLELDNKKIMAAKETAIEFHTKKISLTNIRLEVLNEIHKFPFLLQRLVLEEVHAIAKRLEEGKCLPNLVSTECLCRFFNQYMLLRCHIFHEQLCGTNILTPEAWENFQRTFEEGGLEVYQTRGIVEIPVVQTPAADKAAKKSQSKMNELFERTRDYYYRLAEKSIDKASRFVGNLEKILEPPQAARLLQDLAGTLLLGSFAANTFFLIRVCSHRELQASKYGISN
ncbi:2186_t:CDS:2, partial [Dentiscutata erythropus]